MSYCESHSWEQEKVWGEGKKVVSFCQEAGPGPYSWMNSLTDSPSVTQINTWPKIRNTNEVLINGIHSWLCGVTGTSFPWKNTSTRWQSCTERLGWGTGKLQKSMTPKEMNACHIWTLCSPQGSAWAQKRRFFRAIEWQSQWIKETKVGMRESGSSASFKVESYRGREP